MKPSWRWHPQSCIKLKFWLLQCGPEAGTARCHSSAELFFSCTRSWRVWLGKLLQLHALVALFLLQFCFNDTCVLYVNSKCAIRATLPQLHPYLRTVRVQETTLHESSCKTHSTWSVCAVFLLVCSCEHFIFKRCYTIPILFRFTCGMWTVFFEPKRCLTYLLQCL